MTGLQEMKSKAAVLYSINSELKVETLSVEEPKSNEVLIKIGAAGLCHSDVHVITGQAAQTLPCVLGHEGAGNVISCGDNVSKVVSGDRVILSWIPYCGICYQCSKKRTHLCQTYQEVICDGTLMDRSCRFRKDGQDIRQLSMLGCWSEYAIVPEECCVKISKEVPYEVAALLGCAVTTGVGAAWNKAKLKAGDTVVIIGMGGVGLSILMAAKITGASQIICIDKNASVSELTSKFGATDFIESSIHQDVKSKIFELTKIGADHVFESVGNRQIQQQALEYCCPGGQVTFVGLDGPEATIDLLTSNITRNEITVTGSIYGSVCTDRDFVVYSEKFLSGELPIDSLIARRYALEDINQGLRDMLAGQAGRGVIVFAD